MPRRRRSALLALAGLALLVSTEAGAQTQTPTPPPETPQPAPAPEKSPPAPYDPLQGMDPSGRIPKVPLPPDLPEPSRWRYIPEGRLKSGNVFERFLVSSFATPQIFYSDDVGIGGGIAITDIDFRSQRRQEFLGAFLSYTSEGQQRYRLLWRRWLHHQDLPEGGVILEERTWLAGVAGYEKTLSRRFFGIGPETREQDESSYADEFTELGLRSDFALPGPGGDWVASLGIRGAHHNLGPGHVSDIPTTDQAFPVDFAAGDAYTALTLTAGIRYDTRDSQHQPYRGWRVGILADAPVWQSTGDAGAVITWYASVAIPLPGLFHRGGDPREENPPTDTLAFGVQVETTLGTVPFYTLPTLGGTQTLRGYPPNRWTDDSAWHASAEYRFWVIPRGIAFTDILRIERIGFAIFAEAGAVAPSLEAFPDSPIRTSYGIGFRMALERAALFRADIGFSPEGLNLSIGFGLTF
jgi:surface antigen Omp85-like protein